MYVGVLCLSLFCYALLSSFAIMLKRKRKLVALLLMLYRCIVTINVLWLFLTMPWVGLRYVILVFTDHTRLLFGIHSFRETFITSFNSVAKGRDAILVQLESF